MFEKQLWHTQKELISMHGPSNPENTKQTTNTSRRYLRAFLLRMIWVVFAVNFDDDMPWMDVMKTSLGNNIENTKIWPITGSIATIETSTLVVMGANEIKKKQ